LVVKAGIDVGFGARSSTHVIDPAVPIVRQSGRGRFVVVRGPDRGESIVIAGKAITVGSGQGTDFRLSDPTVSRRHLSIVAGAAGAAGVAGVAGAPGDGGVTVRDLGSTNGSFVRGTRFGELVLGFGAKIQIGQTHLKYVPEEEAVELPPADSEAFGALLGREPKMRQVFRLLGVVPDDLARLARQPWPGNVRELRNVIERSCATSHGGVLDLAHFLDQKNTPAPRALPAVEAGLSFKDGKAQVIDAFESEYLRALLARHRGNLSAAAREAQLDRKHLRELLRKHSLRGGGD
jgi:hypothetical protein